MNHRRSGMDMPDTHDYRLRLMEANKASWEIACDAIDKHWHGKSEDGLDLDKIVSASKMLKA